MDLILGDCTEKLKEIETSSVSLVLCDPPYGITRNKWDTPIDLGRLFDCIDRVVKETAPVIFFSSGMLTAKLMTGPWERHWRYNLVWAKNKTRGFLNANRQPLRAHEDIVVFYKKQPTYHPQMNTARVMEKGGGHAPRRTSTGNNYGGVASNTCTKAKTDDRHPTSVLLFPVVNEVDCIHQTQKPTSLLEFLIRSYSNEGDIILDPTMGSGSTGDACRATSRRFIGIEKDSDIFRVAQQRLVSLPSPEMDNAPTHSGEMSV
jgi:hypothetical protein